MFITKPLSAGARLFFNQGIDMGSDIQIRLARNSDVAAISDIYAYHVLHGTGSFEIDPPDAEEMARRMAEVVDRGLPYLVAETGNAVVGYAYASLYRTRVAYRFTLEDSVYVHHAHAGRGIGAALLEELIRACKERGCRQLVAVIGDSQNTASMRLHEKLGFQHSGVLRGVGFKFDRWIDTVFMQLPL
jgi:L-amino acid N-acyltransferase YncA